MTSAIPFGKFEIILEVGHIPCGYKPDKVIKLLQKSYLSFRLFTTINNNKS